MNKHPTYWQAWLLRLQAEYAQAEAYSDRERELDDAISIATYIHWKTDNA